VSTVVGRLALALVLRVGRRDGLCADRLWDGRQSCATPAACPGSRGRSGRNERDRYSLAPADRHSRQRPCPPARGRAVVDQRARSALGRLAGRKPGVSAPRDGLPTGSTGRSLGTPARPGTRVRVPQRGVAICVSLRKPFGRSWDLSAFEKSMFACQRTQGPQRTPRKRTDLPFVSLVSFVLTGAANHICFYFTGSGTRDPLFST
jgi:hypothetical protein